MKYSALCTLFAAAIIVIFAGCHKAAVDTAPPESSVTVLALPVLNELPPDADAALSDGVLSVTLHSQAAAHCTIADIQSAMEICDAAHMGAASGQIQDLQLTIYGSTGTPLFDVFQYDITPAQTKCPSRSGAYPTPASTSSILSAAKACVPNWGNVRIQHAEVQPAAILSGNCLTMVLAETTAAVAASEDCAQLYAALAQIEEIQQCSVTVNDMDGNAVFYFCGNFDLGDFFLWSSPALCGSSGDTPGPPPAP